MYQEWSSQNNYFLLQKHYLFLYKIASYSLLYKQILFNNFEKYLHLKFRQKGPDDIPYNLGLV
jgi:hypothetical protein